MESKRDDRTAFEEHSQKGLEKAKRSIYTLISNAQAFIAYDEASKSISNFGNDPELVLLQIRALVMCGAMLEARTRLSVIAPKSFYNLRFSKNDIASIKKTLAKQDPRSPSFDSEHISVGLRKIRTDCSDINIPQQEILGYAARIEKEIWRRSNDPNSARKCRDYYLIAFCTTGGIWTGVNAATMTAVVGAKEFSRTIAKFINLLCIEQLKKTSTPDCWTLATLGETCLLLNNPADAIQWYSQALSSADCDLMKTAAMRSQVKMINTHCPWLSVPAELLSIFRSPVIVAFSGNMIDEPGRSSPRFPNSRKFEYTVRGKLDELLESIDAKISYSSAACGSDIILLEAMRARNAETNIILPFDRSDFIATSVSYAGSSWVKRYNKCMDLATSVRFVTTEKYLSDDILFDQCNRSISGSAHLRAQRLDTEPQLVVVWDSRYTDRTGGTSAFIRRWPGNLPIHAIDISSMEVGHISPIPRSSKISEADQPPESGSRVIRAMLFADIVGYSSLDEERFPSFVHKLYSSMAKALFAHIDVEPECINTWGDALFVAMTGARPLAKYALILRDLVHDWAEAKEVFPQSIAVRIALHAGPVFPGVDPFTGRKNLYGSHVNRAARLEPVTIPGQVYASEQFATMMMDEVSCEAQGFASDVAETFEYVGILALAKGFGVQPVYRLRRKHEL